MTKTNDDDNGVVNNDDSMTWAFSCPLLHKNYKVKQHNLLWNPTSAIFLLSFWNVILFQQQKPHEGEKKPIDQIESDRNEPPYFLTMECFSCNVGCKPDSAKCNQLM